ncbi:MAG: exo-alpha-sialidase [Bryobacterales bacterium]|nr:exo-alpha-sialidase [Bryobacterales bacterium]
MKCTLLASLALLASLGAQPTRDPAMLLANSEILAEPKALLVAPARTSSVFRAKQGWQFNLHSYLARFGGKFWAVWSSGHVDEDSPTQLIRYATSTDGHTWSESRILADDPDGPNGPGSWIARGIFVQDGKLVAYNAYREDTKNLVRGTEIWPKLKLFRFDWNGSVWLKQRVVVDNCMSNYPPRPVAGRLLMTCRDSYMKMYTALSSDLTDTKWTLTPLPGERPHDAMSEPSWYVDPDGAVHMFFRDGYRSKFLYRSVSRDNGRTWPAPVRTNYPDAGSKNFAGRLSNGWYYLINNVDPNSRDPLGISFSRDGWTFSRPMALRANAPKQRFPGRAKITFSFQYPHAIEHNGSLWVIYSTNKEDIEISEFRIADFPLDN